MPFLVQDLNHSICDALQEKVTMLENVVSLYREK